MSVFFLSTMPERETYFTFVSPFYPAHTPASQIFGFYVCFGSRLEQLPGRGPPSHTHTATHTPPLTVCQCGHPELFKLPNYKADY